MNRRHAAVAVGVALLTVGAVGVALPLAPHSERKRPPEVLPVPAPSELLVVLEPPPDGAQLVRVERAEPGATLDGGDGRRRIRFVRLESPEVREVAWEPLESTRPTTPAGFVAVPGLDPGARSLALEFDNGASVSVWPEPLDRDQLVAMVRVEGRAATEAIPLGIAASARTIRARSGWLLEGRLVVPFEEGVVAIRWEGATVDGLVDIAQRLQVTDDEGFRRWAGAFSRSGSPTSVRVAASGTTPSGANWRVRTEIRDGLGTAVVRLDGQEQRLVAPGDVARWPGAFIALVSTAGTVRTTVDDRPVPVRVVPVAGRAVLVIDDLPRTGRLEIVTPLQRWSTPL
ncbi:MAG: hypothetical protein ACKO91_10905 [Acidimicrobiales bacterium]